MSATFTASNGVEVQRSSVDPTEAYARSRRNPTSAYRITNADTLHPRCECTAAQHGRDCGHVEAWMEYCIAVAAKEQPMTNETQALVPQPMRASVTARAENTRAALAAVRGGFQDALYVAQQLDHLWPEELRNMGPERGGKTAAVIVQTAVELGVPAMAAFSYITVIKGKPFLMARMIGALIQGTRSGYIEYVERKPTRCTVRAHRPGRPVTELTVTMEDAVKAKWTERNPNYKTNPTAMLAARATTQIGWAVWPDVLAGMDVAEEGNTVITATEAVEQVPERAFRVVDPAGSAVAEAMADDMPEETFAEPPEEAEWADIVDTPVPSGDAFDSPGGESGADPDAGDPSIDYEDAVDRVVQNFGAWGIELGTDIGWGAMKVALGLPGSKPADLREDLIGWMRENGGSEPAWAVHEALAAWAEKKRGAK